MFYSKNAVYGFKLDEAKYFLPFAWPFVTNLSSVRMTVAK